MLLHFWLLQTILYCAMQFLHWKSCSQDLCPCCCGRRIYEMSLHAFHFSVVLQSWDPPFCATSFKLVLARIQPPGSYCSCIHVCQRTLTKSQSRRVFHCWIRVLSTLLASYFWFLNTLCPIKSTNRPLFPRNGPLKVIQSRNQNFYFHWKPCYKTRTRKPGTDIGKHGYLVLENGRHLVREERRFYRTNQISVGFDHRTDILREECYMIKSYLTLNIWKHSLFVKTQRKQKTGLLSDCFSPSSCESFFMWSNSIPGHARIQRGGPGVLRFVRGGVLCGGLIGRRGGPKVVFILFSYFFWLAPLASIIHSVHIWKIQITSKFKG